jgi:hypothetical protein
MRDAEQHAKLSRLGGLRKHGKNRGAADALSRELHLAKLTHDLARFGQEVPRLLAAQRDHLLVLVAAMPVAQPEGTSGEAA